ncbi:MAG TPA: branched-chain amino acid ABC transporter permease [Candidatus Dormibacteraeota bacterium]|nr:branched-chain amino acid ABC transporter permease [Candidatus Dormibacteraeota bacterium]
MSRLRRVAPALGLVAVLGVAAWMPQVLGPARQLSMSLALIFAIAALSVVVLTGWTGQTSLAQVTFMGVGAFVAARLMAPGVGLPVYLAAPAAVLAAALVSIVVGLPALRLRGVYLAVVTLGFAQVMQDAVFNNSTLTGSQNGLTVARPVLGRLDLTGEHTLYWLLLAVLVGCCLLVGWLRRSSLGRRMISLRTTEVGATARGIDLVSTKLLAFSVSAALAGLAGVLYALEVQSVGPAPFNPLQSIFLLGLVVIAGQRSIGAALVAGALYGWMPPELSRHFTDSTFGPNATNLVAGVGLLLVLVGREQLSGIAGRIPRRPWPWPRPVTRSPEVSRNVPA